MKNTELVIGLFGYGCVGKGVFKLLSKTPNVNARIKRIVIKDISKERDIPINWFTTNKFEVLNDPEINTIVEAINNADEAFELVSAAIIKGKSIITANKKMVAHYYTQLVELEQLYGGALLIEASVGGAIPIINTLQSFYSSIDVGSISGILNGTSNYILTKLENGNTDFATALNEAQSLGFAEIDSTLDITGLDSKYKLIVLIAQAFGKIISPEDVIHYGIKSITRADILFAKNLDKKYRLVAFASSNKYVLQSYVLPTWVGKGNPFYEVNDEFNAINLQSEFSDSLLLKGKGAGSFPTASAILSNIVSLQNGYVYPSFIQRNQLSISNSSIFNFYLRYKDPELLKKAGIDTIYYHTETNNIHYAVVSMSLKTLKHMALFPAEEMFLAVIEEDITEILDQLNIQLGNSKLTSSVYSIH